MGANLRLSALAVFIYLCRMTSNYFTYNKAKVIQALRYHFVQRNEVRVLIILVNVFAIISAILFYMKKIRPEPFLLGSFIWIVLMATFWYFLPQSIYKKAATFLDSFIIDFREDDPPHRGYMGGGAHCRRLFWHFNNCSLRKWCNLFKFRVMLGYFRDCII